MQSETARAAIAEMESQGELKAGTLGWWWIMAAESKNVRAGDLILIEAEGGNTWFYVEDTFTTKNRYQRIGIVINTDEKKTLGIFHPIIVMRRGTKTTF